MSSEEVAQIEGLDDDDLNNLMGDDDSHEDGEGHTLVSAVEAQNDALMEYNFKKYLSLFKSKGAKIDHGLSKEIFQKETYKAASFPSDVAEIVKMDLPELTKLLSDLKNSIMGMRIKVASIIDFLNESSVDPSDSITLINLRMEVLADYWTYLSLLVLKKLNGDSIADHPIVKRLMYLRQFLAKLKPIYKKMDFQISRLVSLAGKDITEINLDHQDDAMFMRPNLNFDELDGEFDEGMEDELDEKTKALIKRKVDRELENGYGGMDKSQKKDLIKAIRAKREKMNKEERKEDKFKQFQKSRLLKSKLIQDMEDELENRPYETEKRPNIAGVYDPMQEEREKTDSKNWTKTVLTKEQKKIVNKRINRLKQQQKVDDFTEIKEFGNMMSRNGGDESTEFKKKTKIDQLKQKKKGNWQINKDEEKYDSKRQAKLRRAGKIKHKKGRK